MIILCFLPNTIHAEYDIPEYIKVGIRSGSNAVATIELSSSVGFDFGYIEKGQLISLYDLVDNQKIYVRKDSYYIQIKDYFYEYNFKTEEDENNSNITGPIHIQLGGSYSSKTDAIAFIDSIEHYGLKPFLSLDGKWKVWLGNYTTYNQAEKDFNELKSIVPDIDLTVISKNSKRVQVINETGDILFIYNPSYANYYFKPKNDTLVTLDNKKFRGCIMIKNASNGNMTIINRLTLTEYLYGVLPKEMPYTAHIEALKAQAVAARNYTVININRHSNEGFDVCASTHCQVYGGYSSEKQSCNDAVNATRDMILLHNGRPISAFYHSHSGGHTENIENIWQSPIAYLKGVKDPYGEPYRWEVSYTAQELSKALEIKGYHVGEILDVYIDDISEFGSVQTLVIKGSQGDVVLKKNDIRKVLGYTTIRSLKFGIYKDHALCIKSDELMQNQEVENISIINGDGEIKKVTNGEQIMISNGLEMSPFKKQKESSSAYYFKGNGYGHSIGMSQRGAMAMAESGFTFEEILKHYYTEVTLIHNN